jgi:hypothetical protein
MCVSHLAETGWSRGSKGVPLFIETWKIFHSKMPGVGLVSRFEEDAARSLVRIAECDHRRNNTTSEEVLYRRELYGLYTKPCPSAISKRRHPLAEKLIKLGHLEEEINVVVRIHFENISTHLRRTDSRL